MWISSVDKNKQPRETLIPLGVNDYLRLCGFNWGYEKKEHSALSIRKCQLS